MAKEGLNHHVAQHPDPTYEAVLHNVRQEAKEKRKEASQKGFRCICSIRKYIRENGFELADDLAIRDVYTKRVFRSMVPASKLAPRPKERC